MVGQNASIRRIVATTLAVVGLAAGVVACATDSPKEQGARERKAASVQVFKLSMSKDLWTRTNHQGEKKIEKPKSLTENPNGTVTIELTGPQMVDYLKMLDYNAHGGAFAEDTPLAATVYNALAPVVDRIESTPAPDAPAPEVTIDAAAGTPTTPTSK
jgi:hypothetical protein